MIITMIILTIFTILTILRFGSIMRPRFREKFQLNGIFKKMFRCGSLNNEPAVQAKIPTKWNFQNLQKSKKYNIHIYKKNSCFQGICSPFFFKIFEKKIHGVFTLQFINFGDAKQLVCFIILHSFSMKITQQVTP